GDMPPAGGAVRDVAIAAVVRASAGAGTVVTARTVSSARDCAVFMAGFLMDSHCDRFTRRPRGPSTGWGLRAPDAVNSAARPPGPAHSLLARRSARGRITPKGTDFPSGQRRRKRAWDVAQVSGAVTPGDGGRSEAISQPRYSRAGILPPAGAGSGGSSRSARV